MNILDKPSSSNTDPQYLDPDPYCQFEFYLAQHYPEVLAAEPADVDLDTLDEAIDNYYAEKEAGFAEAIPCDRR